MPDPRQADEGVAVFCQSAAHLTVLSSEPIRNLLGWAPRPKVHIVLPKYTLRASKLKKTDAYLPIFMIGTINMRHKLSSLGFTAAEDTIFTPH